MHDPAAAIVRGDLDPAFDFTVARREWWATHGEPQGGVNRTHSNIRDPNRVLRVGYVSGDFRHHSAGIIFGPVVLGHSDRFKVYGYSTCPPDKHDPTTGLYRDDLIWRDVHDMDHAALTQTIQEDAIDILVDLSGFTQYNRLEAFCAKPAPVQVTAWGYAVPTELPVFDAFFSDPVHYPKGMRACREPVVDLPCAVTYDPPPLVPEPQSLPDRPPVFGSLNRVAKLDPRVLRAWRDILLCVPGSTLVLKDGEYVGEIGEWVLRELGAAAPQARFLGETPHREHILTYQGIDLALDPFLHSGGVTTLEGLWMGVLPVTLPGTRPFTRISASALSILGLHNFIASSPEEYVAKAVEWVTTRRQELSKIRTTLRQRLQASPIMAGYVDAVEAAYRELWGAWCRG